MAAPVDTQCHVKIILGLERSVASGELIKFRNLWIFLLVSLLLFQYQNGFEMTKLCS